MRKLLLMLSVLLPLFSGAQHITFETLTLPKPDTFYVNYSAPGQDVGFNDFLHFPCVYDTSGGFHFWSSGFAYSNMTDSVTSGFGNQYAAKAGSGDSGSQKYAVAYGATNYVHNGGYYPRYLYVTNTTYAYNSMRDGDAFAKKFGGVSGNDPDWFKLVIHGYNFCGSRQDSVEFYLADFRFANNAQDYILKNWTRVDLGKLNCVDTIWFSLSSSDTGMFGMNTPAYFCLDDFVVDHEGVANIPFETIAKIYPNPTTDKLCLEIKGQSINKATVFDATGKVTTTIPISNTNTIINTSGWRNGMYFLRLEGKKGTANTRFIKQ